MACIKLISGSTSNIGPKLAFGCITANAGYPHWVDRLSVNGRSILSFEGCNGIHSPIFPLPDFAGELMVSAWACCSRWHTGESPGTQQDRAWVSVCRAGWKHTWERQGDEVVFAKAVFFFFLMIPIKCQRSSRQILARWAYLLVFRQGGRRGLWNFICLPWWHCLMLSHLGCPEKCIFTASTMLFFFL